MAGACLGSGSRAHPGPQRSSQCFLSPICLAASSPLRSPGPALALLHRADGVFARGAGLLPRPVAFLPWVPLSPLERAVPPSLPSCREGPACQLLQGNALRWSPHPMGLAGSSGSPQAASQAALGPRETGPHTVDKGLRGGGILPACVSGHFCRMHLETTRRAIRKVVWGLTASLTAGLWPVSA